MVFAFVVFAYGAFVLVVFVYGAFMFVVVVFVLAKEAAGPVIVTVEIAVVVIVIKPVVLRPGTVAHAV